MRSMNTVMLIAALLAVAANPVFAEPFKCRNNGKLIIQDRPCPGSARYSDDFNRLPKSGAGSASDEEQIAAQRAKTERDKAYIDERVKARVMEREKNEAAAWIVACDAEVRRLEAEIAAIASSGTYGTTVGGAILEQEWRQTRIAALRTQIDAKRHQCDLRREEFKRKFD